VDELRQEDLPGDEEEGQECQARRGDEGGVQAQERDVKRVFTSARCKKGFHISKM